MFLSIAAFIAVFTVVVLVHELGHFLAARRAGVNVYEFSIGFPFSTRIVTLFRHRETEFTLRLLPLGGFVSFSGDGDEDAMELFGASRMHRLQIMFAGSLFNIVFALFTFIIVFFIGKDMHQGAAILSSAKTICAMVSGTVEFLAKAFTGQGSMDGLAGPVGIAVIAGKAASKGFMDLLYFTGMLSLSLGIMNLLPLPALDGGQMVMLFVESLRKKPVSMKVYQAVNLIGFTFIMLLSVLVTYKDIIKLIA
jgi:regulator of sigma E protease